MIFGKVFKEIAKRFVWLNFMTKLSTSETTTTMTNLLGSSKKYNSCSTIFVDDSTVSQPNLKSAIRLVSFAIHYHIKRRTSNRSLDIFDEKLHPINVKLLNWKDISKLRSQWIVEVELVNCNSWSKKINQFF